MVQTSLQAVIFISDLEAASLRVCGLTVAERNSRSLKKSGFAVVLSGPLSATRHLRQFAEKLDISFVDEKDLHQFNAYLKISGDVQFSMGFFAGLFETVSQNQQQGLLLQTQDHEILAAWYSSHEGQPQVRTMAVADYHRVVPLLSSHAKTQATKLLGQRLFTEIYSKTRGWIARGLNKKISFPITRLLVKTSITPNQLTVAGFSLGLVGCLLLLSHSWVVRVAGALLLQFNSILDGCDGEVARLKVVTSKMGAWLDTISDDVLNNAMLICLSVGLFTEFHNVLLFKLCMLTSLASFGVSFFLYHFMITHNDPDAANYRLSWAVISEETRQNLEKSPSGFSRFLQPVFEKLKPVLKRDFFIFLSFILILLDLRLLLLSLFVFVWCAFVIYFVSFLHFMIKGRGRYGMTNLS